MKTNSKNADMPRSAGHTLKSGHGVKVEKSITIHRPVSDVYAYWRELQNLPHFMTHLESVTPRDEALSHWVMKTSGGRILEWDAQIIEDKPDEMISWQSLADSDVDNAGSVWFTPALDGQGTNVKVSMKISPRGGKLGVAIAKLSGDDPEDQLAEDLIRFKKLLEHIELAGAGHQNFHR